MRFSSVSDRQFSSSLSSNLLPMRLEKEIQQVTPFKTEWQRAAVNLIYTTNWVTNQQKELFKPYKVTMQQYNVLRILRGQHPEPISTSDIRNRMLDKMSDVSRIVDRLVKKNLVLRRTCETDKRLVDVVISKEGLALLKKMDKHTRQDMDHFMANLSEEECAQLNALLDKLRGGEEATSE